MTGESRARFWYSKILGINPFLNYHQKNSQMNKLLLEFTEYTWGGIPMIKLLLFISNVYVYFISSWLWYGQICMLLIFTKKEYLISRKLELWNHLDSAGLTQETLDGALKQYKYAKKS